MNTAAEEHYLENLYIVRRLSEHKIKRDPDCSTIWKRNWRNTRMATTKPFTTIVKMPKFEQHQ